MKKESATGLSEEFSRNGGGKACRTTIFLSESLDFYLDCFALESRRAKGDIVREALAQFLQSAGGYKNVNAMPSEVKLVLK